MYSKTLIAACASAATLLTASAAQAAVEIHNEFATLCLKTTSPDAAEAAARAAGYTRASAELAKSVAALGDGDVFSREVEGQTLVFISTNAARQSAITGKLLTADACVVASKPLQPGLGAALKPLIGVGEPQNMSGERTFIFEQQGEKRLRVDTSNRQRAAMIAKRGALRMVMFTEKAGYSAAMLVKPVI